MPHRVPLPVLVGLILIAGAGVFVARHRVLQELRRERFQPSADADTAHDSRVAMEAGAPAVPAGLLRLRAEHQRLQREVAAADDRVRNLTRPPEFQPGTHPQHAAQAAMFEELNRISGGPDFEAARNVGQALAEYLARNNGRLPASMESVLTASAAGSPAVAPANPESNPLRSFELIAAAAQETDRWTQRIVARSEELTLASGQLARIFIRGDGSVLIGTVDSSGDWADWLTSQSARSQVADPE